MKMKNRKTKFAILLFLFLTVSLSAQSPIDSYEEGSRFISEGNYFSALDSFKKALDVNPAYVDALIGIARTYFLLQEYEEALDYSRLALKGAEKRIDAINLQGRIYLGLGDLESAEKMFWSVKNMEPNNMDAAYGLAEIAVFRGNYKEGTSLFEKSLAINPDSRRALLSLVVLADRMGDREKAGAYLTKALKYYPQDRIVLNEAVLHYTGSGEWDQAEGLAQQLVALDPENKDTTLILGQIYTNSGNYTQAVHYFQESIRNEQDNPMIWYYLGRAFAGLEKYDEALLCFKTVNLLDPLDEVARMAAENLLMTHFPLNHEERVQAASWHFQKGRSYKAAYQFEKAFFEYRRGRLLAPLDLTGWWEYAGILDAMGQDHRYRDEMKALKREEYANTEFLRLYELVMSGEDSSLTATWEGPLLKRDTPLSLGIFIDRSESRLLHQGGEEDFIRYMGDALMRNPGFVIRENRVISSPSDAFSSARSEETDYYMILKIIEMERSIRISCRIYLSRTGTEMTAFDLLRSGNMRIREILRKTAEEVEARLPLKGFLAGVEGDNVLINLGSLNRIEPDMSFILLRKGTGRWLDTEPYRDYKPEDVLGMITVDTVQESFSLGKLKRNSPFDMVNPGDEVYKLPENTEELVLTEDTMNDELKTQLLRLY